MRQVVDSQVGDVRQSPVQLGLDAPEAVVVVHVEGGEGETVVTVHGVPGVAVVQVLVVEPEGVPLTA